MTYSSSEGFLTRTIVLTLATILAAWILPGVDISSVWAAIGTAIVIALLDNLIRPILIVVTLPVTVVSLGLFVFVINALIIEIASAIVRGFSVDGFGSALLFSLLLTLFNYLLELPRRQAEQEEYHDNDSPRIDNNRDDDHFDDYEEVQ